MNVDDVAREIVEDLFGHALELRSLQEDVQVVAAILTREQDSLWAEVERLRGLANLLECEIELLRSTLAQTTDTIAQHGEVPEQLKEWRDVLWSTGLSRAALAKGATE